MITAVISGLKEKNGSSRRVEGTVNIPFDLNSAGSRRRHGRPPKPRLESVQNDVPVFVHGVQNSMATVPPPPTSSAANDAVSSPPPPRVFGCVIGIQRGRTVKIFNSFELLNFLMCVRGVIVILGFYGSKLIIGVLWDADKKVFPHFYVLGWYSTGSDAQETDMQIHKTRRE
ncbi:MPN domain-containing protein [Forsythia ovata]|uniref:MPN domain-containing protein n=1 Tax=Forsythia ovata TaxID=205694 RepID=A0ABD1T2U1_9LAMI